MYYTILLLLHRSPQHFAGPLGLPASADVLLHVSTYIYIYIYMCIYTYIHTYKHTYTYTYTCTYIYTYRCTYIYIYIEREREIWIPIQKVGQPLQAESPCLLSREGVRKLGVDLLTDVWNMTQGTGKVNRRSRHNRGNHPIRIVKSLSGNQPMAISQL